MSDDFDSIAEKLRSKETEIKTNFLKKGQNFSKTTNSQVRQSLMNRLNQTWVKVSANSRCCLNF
jgi:hypothetical protein